jgi:hypothetical protein
MSTFHWVTIAYFVLACIHTFDKRLIQQRRLGEDCGTPPAWVGNLSYAMYGMQVWMLILDWKRALVLFVIAFILAVLPVLETIGNLLCSPLNRSRTTRNETLDQDGK